MPGTKVLTIQKGKMENRGTNKKAHTKKEILVSFCFLPNFLFTELKKIASGLLDRGEKQAASGVVTKDKKELRRKSVTSSETASKADKKE